MIINLLVHVVRKRRKNSSIVDDPFHNNNSLFSPYDYSRNAVGIIQQQKDFTNINSIKAKFTASTITITITTTQVAAISPQEAPSLELKYTYSGEGTVLDLVS